MMDENTAVFAAGNVVELLDLRAKEQKYLRSTSGGGIGALAVCTPCYYVYYFNNGKTIVLLEWGEEWGLLLH